MELWKLHGSKAYWKNLNVTLKTISNFTMLINQLLQLRKIQFSMTKLSICSSVVTLSKKKIKAEIIEVVSVGCTTQIAGIFT